MQEIILRCQQNLNRVAELGSWPAWIDREQSLVGRIPQDQDAKAPGLDAGLACALDLIPRECQKLAATLHAAYTQAAVEQVRTESIAMDPDSETCWWLSACSVCREGEVNASAFCEQLEQFRQLAADPTARVEAARRMLDNMKKTFTTLVDGTPFVTVDGGLQGAYVAGHDWGVQYAPAFGIFFVGTFRASLGLEDFEFSPAQDEQGRPLSGPVHGSQQFVKAATLDELAEVVRVVRSHLD